MPALVAPGAAFLLPVVLWFWYWYRLRGRTYEFDFGGNKASFPILHVPYRGFFYVIFFSALAGSVLSVYLKRFDIGLVLLAAALLALLFNGLLTFYYESYLAHRYSWDPAKSDMSNYTAAKYGLILSLGVSSLVLFIFGTLLLFLSYAGY